MDITTDERTTIEQLRQRQDKAACLFLQKIQNRIKGLKDKSGCGSRCCSSVDRRVLHKGFFDWYDALYLQDLLSRSNHTSLA